MKLDMLNSFETSSPGARIELAQLLLINQNSDVAQTGRQMFNLPTDSRDRFVSLIPELLYDYNPILQRYLVHHTLPHTYVDYS